MINNLIIAGCNFIGLYSAIKCIDNGYDVTIIEKKNTYNDNKNYYRIFNKNHLSYINLLNKFSISYNKYTLKYNDKTYNILFNIINKSKMITKKSLNSQNFVIFCRTILSTSEYNILKNNIEDFETIYNNISAMFAITFFSNDINKDVEYYILNDDKSLLIDKMINYIYENNGYIIYNTDIKDINFRKYIYVTTKYKTYISNILILTLSKDNLMRFRFLNKEQKKLLNNVTKYNIDSEKIFSDSNVEYEKDIKEHLLDNIHIVCPIKKFNMYLWNVGINDIMIKEKIKQLFSHIYICSDSYSKNPFFANYALETYDEINSKILSKLSSTSKRTISSICNIKII
tara:strand:- start:12068 stop:13096 length:1029 start_codon:yes stop_codon:yes gene_type:complete